VADRQGPRRPGGDCPDIQVGDDVAAENVKKDELLFDAESAESIVVKRSGQRVR
jgi:hypothetical protein